MLWKLRQRAHFLFCYLNQPIINQESKGIWHPKRFWSAYQIELLENCWGKSPQPETSQYKEK